GVSTARMNLQIFALGVASLYPRCLSPDDSTSRISIATQGNSTTWYQRRPTSGLDSSPIYQAIKLMPQPLPQK
ncbi:MAG: hypothetical protein K2X63_03275, partial [Burkholderiaceae bacterium]|nr:hypothetical protein [Burkholderiaceae bacterium]